MKGKAKEKSYLNRLNRALGKPIGYVVGVRRAGSDREVLPFKPVLVGYSNDLPNLLSHAGVVVCQR